MIIRAKIDVTKISKAHIFQGAKGKYIDITLLENRDGADAYGNNFMVVQDLGKESRERGEKGPILGNGKTVGDNRQQSSQSLPPRQGPQSSRPAPSTEGLDEDVPF